jgi:ketosteroid isomerase-like protein
MNSILRCLSIASICMLIFTVSHPIVATLAAQPSALASDTKPCSAPEYHQFDFWAGDWEAFDLDDHNTKVAHNRVDRILDGCVLLEDYRQKDGTHGESFSIYDATRKVWHQSWVTNHGVLLTIEGKMQNGEMILSGSDRTTDGKERQVRGVWKAIDGGVRETAVRSTYGGKTWSPWFDLMFRPAASRINSGDPGSGEPKGDPKDERATIAALDTQYQAAVKINDAATMDRLLADDFMLVTGSGKTYDKAALLEEARSGRFHYEHQEDTEQTVRIWGDTAVVTAKLWEQGTENGKPFDYTVWFSDTYVRTPTGWRYVFGQSSGPLPKPPR